MKRIPHAYGLEDDVPDEVKQERAEAVMALQQGYF
jgi:tRNA A37 methylthiotransferase MiaB